MALGRALDVLVMSAIWQAVCGCPRATRNTTSDLNLSIKCHQTVYQHVGDFRVLLSEEKNTPNSWSVQEFLPSILLQSCLSLELKGMNGKVNVHIFHLLNCGYTDIFLGCKLGAHKSCPGRTEFAEGKDLKGVRCHRIDPLKLPFSPEVI